MPRETVIAPDDTVGLKLIALERKLLLDSLLIPEDPYLDRIRQTPSKESVRFTLDELEDLADYVSDESKRTDDSIHVKKLDKIVDRIDRLLEAHENPSLITGDHPLNKVFSGINPLTALTDLLDTADEPTVLSVAPVCRVVFTKAQRAVLLEMDTVSGDIHKMLAVDSRGEHTFHFNNRQSLVLGLAGMDAIQQSHTDKQRGQLMKIVERIFEGLEMAMQEEAEMETPLSTILPESVSTGAVYQLKITLEDIKPPIWRRVHVPDCTLDVLHEIIQIAMGWENCHMHSFRAGDVEYGMASLEGIEDTVEESRVLLSDLVEQGHKKFRYWYDFGDDWWHTILVEKSLEPKSKDRLPTCVKGARACPPEDVGGVWGYQNLLEALSDPQHEDHEEMEEWCGNFDPGEFSVDEVNQELAT